MGLEKFGTELHANESRSRNRDMGEAMGAAGDTSVERAPQQGPERQLSSITQWSQTGGDEFRFSGPTRATLPPGAYIPFVDSAGPAVCKKVIITDRLIDFKGSLPSRVLHEISGFWELGERYHRLGFLHRRGYMFYGPQGTGKSSVVAQVIQDIVQQGHLAFFCANPRHLVVVMSMLRQVEPHRPMVCVFEDIDAIMGRHGDSELLQWFDGADQVDKVVNIATTNYPERLDPRIVARPRRFDSLIEVGELPAEVRRAYFEAKLTEAADDGEFDRSELEHLVDVSVDLPFAALAELVIAIKCHGMDLRDTIDRLLSMIQERPRMQDSRGPFGFGRMGNRRAQPSGDDLEKADGGYQF